METNKRPVQIGDKRKATVKKITKGIPTVFEIEGRNYCLAPQQVNHKGAKKQ